MEKISEHIYWQPPGEPDRPSLCAVVGSNRTLLLDAGSSGAHLRIVLDGLKQRGIDPPSLIALTHWHWDHVFATGEIDAPVIAHEQTAVELERLAGYDWDDAALDARSAAGIMVFSGAHIKEELPTPRVVRIAPAAITFKDSLTVHLGGVSCRIHHVSGDHSEDSCVIYVEQDRVLFLGDCLYDAVYAPVRHYTPEKLIPLIDRLNAFDVDQYVGGHNPTIVGKPEFVDMTSQMRAAAEIVQRVGKDEAAVFAAARERFGELTEDNEYDLRALLAGLA